jgi:hypothetical protein
MLATTNKTVMEQLADIAVTYEQDYKGVHSWQHEYSYCKSMLDRRRIITYEQKGIVLGYFEVWFINFEQFGRLICHDNFNQLEENISQGNIAYVANTWIHPDFRNGVVYKILRNRFFAKCKHCDYYCGVALRKKTQPVKVYRVKDLVNKLYKGDNNGN